MLHRGAALCAVLAVLCALLPPLPAAGEVLYDTEGGEPLAALLAEGDEAWAAVQIDAPGRLLLKKGEQKDVAYTAQLPDTVDAPVEEGQVLGTWQIAVGGEVRGEYPIRAAAAVPARTFGWAYRTLVAALIG